MLDQAIAGIKVLDLGHYVAGPYCAKLLADYGAEVIKIERPEGDPSRRLGPFPHDEPDREASGLFVYLNNNKKGITLNLKTESGKRILRELVKKVDVVIENFSPRVMPSLGLDYESLKAINPDLVMTSISNFGQTGPYRDFPATDLTLQSLAGWLQVRGLPEREPIRAAGQLGIVGYIGGVYAATAALSAAMQKIYGLGGNHVDVSLMEAIVIMPPYPVAMSKFPHSVGWPQQRVPYIPGVEKCKDGYIGINTLTGAHWRDTALMMGMDDIAENPDYQTRRGRNGHKDELTTRMQPWLSVRTKEDILAEGADWRIPVSPVYNNGELLECPQYKARDFFVEVDHPVLGKTLQPSAAFKMSETPWQLRYRAPLLGEHNEEIYGELLGHKREDLVRLRQAGVI